ncbi:MAG: hypothetical protein JWR11_1259 [Mycobacterium sp.]|nr:hypothetical protein [Mycobacterium sp.]MDT5177846.1 hypothetical protein [Mycobacterium sp.]
MRECTPYSLIESAFGSVALTGVPDSAFNRLAQSNLSKGSQSTVIA